MTSNLPQAFKNLNPAQKKAVSPEGLLGPMLVLAGPGTGKTHMLTLRIAQMLEQNIGCEPENILCLTFTENAAVEMRDRLGKWIGSTAYRLQISTFHGFCQWVMDRYPETFDHKAKRGEVITDLEKALIYEAIIKSKSWEHFRNLWDDFSHRRDFFSAVSQMKRENVSLDDFLQKIPKEKERLEALPSNFYKKKYKNFEAGDWKPQEKKKIENKISKMYEFLEIWKLYEQKMRSKGFYDFDDMIGWVVEALEQDENLRQDLQEKFQWILVDEYQDTNTAQCEILWQLTRDIPDPNIFVVGDDDQSIYRFQGASVANIQTFRKKFPTAQEIVLEENYRSYQNILDGAYGLVKHNNDRADVNRCLISKKTEKKSVLANNPEKNSSLSKGDLGGFIKKTLGSIIQQKFESREEEVKGLIKNIEQKKEQGIPYSEMAILVRNNREIEDLSRRLPLFGIEVSAQISQNIFENEFVVQLILMLEVFSDPAYDEKFFDLMHSEFLGISGETLLRVSLERNRSKKPFLEYLLALKTEMPLATKPPLSKRDLEEFINNKEGAENLDPKIFEFFDFFITARSKFFHCRPRVLAEKMLYESGLAEFMTNTKKNGDWICIQKFLDWIDEAKPDSLKALLKLVNLHQTLGIKIAPDPLPQDKKSLKIMTAHKSKGLEFEVVFIPGLEDKKWGNKTQRENISLPQLIETQIQKSELQTRDNEEERRLFFVALTRAKSEVFLSFSTTNFSGREKNPAQFWGEIPEKNKAEVFTENLESEKLLPTFFDPNDTVFTSNQKEILKQKVQNFTWSASSLQNYLDCPRRFLFQNIYRYPRRPQPQLALGVALHESLEKFFRMGLDSKLFLKDQEILQEPLMEFFEYALRGQNLEQSEYEKLEHHGKKVLEIYYDQRLVDFKKNNPFGYQLEFNLGVYKPQIQSIPITGKVDKINFLESNKGAKKRKIKITDYKSGTPKSIKSGEQYWRQLVFYDLLVRSIPKLNWEVDSVAIEFLTPDKNGKIQEKILPINDEDRKKIQEELKWADEQLKNLSFPKVPNPEGDKDIEFWQNLGNF